MKKSLGLSIAAATLLAGNVFAMDLAGGKLTGDVRAAYHAHANAESDDKTEEAHSASALGLGINPAYAIEAASGLTVEVGAGVAVPVTEGDDAEAAGFALGKLNDDGDGSEMYATLTKANVAYDFGAGFVKAGYQELDTPFAGSDDIRLVPNSFMAVQLRYTGVEYLSLGLTQIAQMAGLVDGGADDAETYNSMSTQAFGTANTDDKPLTAVSAVYENEGAGANGQFWYATMAEPQTGLGDVTSMYLDAGKSFGSVNVSAQYISYKTDLQSNSSTGVMAEAGLGDVGVTVAMNSYSFTDDGVGSTQAPGYYAWGGYPEYAVADEMWANSADWDGGTSSKVALSYSGVEKLDLGAAYVTFSDVATVIDVTAGYEVAEHAHLGFVYEIVDLDENTAHGDHSVTKLHASYHF